MYFTKFKEEYIDAVAALEQKVYPVELAIGKEGLLAETREGDCSVCGFLNGEMQCYILASMEDPFDEAYNYISDLNCTNPKFLQRLLVYFFANHGGSKDKCEYVADLRESSYRLLKRRSRCNPDCIQILEDTVQTEFYPNGEDAHKVRFAVSLDKYIRRNWKIAFQLKVDSMPMSRENNFLDNIISYLAELVSQGVNLMQEKNRKFIYKCMEERMLGYYQMFGDCIPAVGFRELYSRGKEKGISAYEKTIRTLEAYGYQNCKGEAKQYKYNEYWHTLGLSIKFEVYNTKYPDTLSGYRWLYKKGKKFAEKYETVKYYDRYGNSRDLIPVPYMSHRKFLYLLEKTMFIYGTADKLNLDEDERFCMINMCEKIWRLLKKSDAILCIESIVSRYDPNVWNYFHDWWIVVQIVEDVVTILTQGAMKTIFSSSYNQANKISEKLGSVGNIVLKDAHSLQMIGINNLRKRISTVIRQGQDINQFVRELLEFIDLQYVKNMRIPRKSIKTTEEFLTRMKKYCPDVTLYAAFKRFGRKNFLSYILGTYPCVFERKVFYLPYGRFVNLLQKELKKRTRQMRHVYYDLKVKNLLAGIMGGMIDTGQYNEILQILRYHNVAIPGNILSHMADFRFVLEQKGSPEFLTAGDASVCCMGFFSEKAQVYAKEKGFGILNAYYRERVIANSLLWINEPYNCLVLDNIEVHPNYTKYKEQLREGFLNSAEQIMQQYQLDFVTQGTQYNDLLLYYADAKTYLFAKKEARGVNQSFYTDADRVKIVKSNLMETELDDLFEKIEGEQKRNESQIITDEFFRACVAA